MRKALLICLLAALAAVAFGCAMTDYVTITPPQNKSHRVIECLTNDGVANTQQTVERDIRGMEYVYDNGNFFFQRINAPLQTFVSHEDAKAWGRFIGSYMFYIEVATSYYPTYGFTGVFYNASFMDLPDGSIVMKTYYRRGEGYDPLEPTGMGRWSCPGGAYWHYGAPEGAAAGDRFRGNFSGVDAEGPWHMQPESVYVDTDPRPGVYGFGRNLRAAIPESINKQRPPYGTGPRLYGRVTYYAFGGRTPYESHLYFAPVQRREGLSAFFMGEPLTFKYAGVDITGHANFDGNGLVTVFLDGLRKDNVEYRAQNPMAATTPLAHLGRQIELKNVSRAELAGLGQFLLDAGLAGTPIELGGFIPELGLEPFPNATILINPNACQAWASYTPGTDGGTGFGG